MKKSDFDEELGKKAGWRTENRHAGEWILIDRSDLHGTLKEAGVQWDPEEPELPKRVKVIGTGTLVTDDSNAAEDQVPMGRLAKEAAARYNLVDSLNLHKADERKLFAAGVLRKWLKEEREKLR